ncbi:TonB family protein [Fibrivirga algicola]|uniref:TonB family protein n=1 Tax=Fibrivirga algicola TaxID=2950420 RepID=A0ABX0QNS0_9BACT|nr:TonB family protein [Fibrivirga algicola]NID12512.1 TonB family protein [Fibrivirga algicola]
MHLANQFTLLSVCTGALALASASTTTLKPIEQAMTRIVSKNLVSVRISVFDEAGPLSGATVSSTDGTQSILTDATGNCQLAIPSGTVLLVSADEHKTFRILVSAKGAEKHSLKLRRLDGSEIVAVAPLVHLSGVVRTAEGQPLEGADVSVSGRGWTTKTDGAGRYTIDVPQNNLLSISKFGYELTSVVVSPTTTSFSPKMALREGIDPSILGTDTKRATSTAVPFASGDYKLASGEVITEADENPVYPGGLEALNTYLTTSIRYPEAARQNNITGKVLVSFVVDTDGSINRIRLLKGLNYGTDEEAVRVIARMPNWTPGKQKGRAVAILYTLPVPFSVTR